MDSFVIGTRGSLLALAQTEEIRGRLKRAFPKIDFRLERIKTSGDRHDQLVTRHAETIGIFTKELEESLLSKKIDIAVHSLKDLPTKNPEELLIAAIPKRETPEDGLVTEEGKALSKLVSGSRIGTGSSRRRAQLLHFNPSFEVIGIRGNLESRLRKLKEGNFDGLVLALAGLRRIGVDPGKISPIPYEVMLPAPGQGALAVQIREGEKGLRDIVASLEDAETRRCVTAERAFLSRLGGGCQLPLGALAGVSGKEITLEAVLMSEDGKKLIRFRLTSGKDPEKVGEELGEKFFAMGAEELLNG